MAKPRRADSLKPPTAVLQIAASLEKAGHEVWCVGGAVRDALLGHPHLDWDFATSATPDQVRTVFGRKRTIPVGIDFGTVGVLDDAGVMHEVTTFRRDVRTDGRHAEVEFGVSLDDDLARRDFTINAIALSPTRGDVRDPFDGQGDLARGVVKAVGVPADRMREDWLRALRALRFAARFDFRIEDDTWAAVCESAPFLTRLSAERVRQELEKTMDQVKAPAPALARWRESGAMRVLLPELARGGEAEQAVDHAAQPGLSRRPGRRLNRFAVWWSDQDAESAEAIALRLRFSKRDAQWLASLVGAWNVLGRDVTASLGADGPAPLAVRRLIARITRPLLPAFFRLADARWSARRGAGASAPSRAAVGALYRRARRVSLTEPIDLRDLAIDGDDLRTLGLAPGPALGKTLSVLLDRVLEDPSVNTRDALMRLATSLPETKA